MRQLFLVTFTLKNGSLQQIIASKSEKELSRDIERIMNKPPDDLIQIGEIDVPLRLVKFVAIDPFRAAAAEVTDHLH
ncbi:hypothetical protein [Ectobacillus ponti]|uniref:Uncharacterized protein n=1 Tax=Ectobacillus ponti TaxID=2961894 RepID=A0AA41X2N8_9BACI|nr:hypothetical protein [Ectobacillus ponti]MCP8967829.1 hypothetical protein [Ectobacillus ponti]